MSSSIKAVLKPHLRDVGSLTVRRVLPAMAARLIGPFIFFDHMGPATLEPGVGLDVRPHPHIGLATVTYLFEGAIMHRDSLGSEQKIVPGDVNWMTAGRGIVHSERTPAEDRASGLTMHGIQTWVALPLDDEEVEPSFEHHAADTLPVVERNGVTLRVIAGTAFGETSPVTTFSGTLYVACAIRAGRRFRARTGARGTRRLSGRRRSGNRRHAARSRPDGRARARRNRHARQHERRARDAARRREAGRRALYRVEFRRQFARENRGREARVERIRKWARCRAKPNGFRCRSARERTSANQRKHEHDAAPSQRRLTRRSSRAACLALNPRLRPNY